MPPAAPLGSVSGIESWPKTLPFGRPIASALGAPAHHPAVSVFAPSSFHFGWRSARSINCRGIPYARHHPARRRVSLGFLGRYGSDQRGTDGRASLSAPASACGNTIVMMPKI